MGVKGKKNILFVSFISITFILLGIYIVKYHLKDLQTLKDNEEQILRYEGKIQALKSQLPKLSQIEEKTKIMNGQSKVVADRIPNVSSATEEMMKLQQYLENHEFYRIKLVEMGHSLLEENMTQRDYMISFVSPYEDVKALVENLNNAYQLINIHELEIDNEVQLQEDEVEILKNYFGEDLSDIVTTSLMFSIYVKENKKEGLYEVQIPTINPTSSPFNAYEKLEAFMAQKQGYTPFELVISDVLTSGDTYQLVGPGDTKHYLGLTSGEETEITIKIKDTGYAFEIKDCLGEVQEATYTYEVLAPYLTITSTMRQIHEVMPEVDIVLCNESSQDLTVEVSGSLLNQIHIYNAMHEEILQGETKGNIKWL